MSIYNFSIIIPHHNCLDLLERCVNSIPNRDDIQIIVVDDNSNDKNKPRLKRNGLEIIYLNQEQSKGPGRARNIGMGRATGRWLLFADSDDYYSDHFSAFLDKYAFDENTDIVYINANLVDENGKETCYYTQTLINNYLVGKPYSEMNLRYSLWTPWSRMIKRQIVLDNKLRFDELPAGNDVIFGLNCSRFSKNIQVEIKTTYLYYKPSGGSATDKAREKMFETRLDLLGRMISIQKEVNYKYPSYLISVIIEYVRLGRITKIKALMTYKHFLRKYHISMISDIWSLIKFKLFKR